jgi:RNA polymerase primary sigma factor
VQIQGADTVVEIVSQETLADPKAIIPGTSSVSSDRLAILDRALTSLDERERAIIFARFGLNESGERLTLEEVGQQYGVTRERIRQLENIALKKLRKAFEDIDTPNLVLIEAKRNISRSQE